MFVHVLMWENPNPNQTKNVQNIVMSYDSVYWIGSPVSAVYLYAAIFWGKTQSHSLLQKGMYLNLSRLFKCLND